MTGAEEDVIVTVSFCPPGIEIPWCLRRAQRKSKTQEEGGEVSLSGRCLGNESSRSFGSLSPKREGATPLPFAVPRGALPWHCEQSANGHMWVPGKGPGATLKTLLFPNQKEGPNILLCG